MKSQNEPRPPRSRDESAAARQPVSMSDEMRTRAHRSLAGGVSSSFRAHEQPRPLTFQSASGAHVVDLDGNTYVDYVCGFGPIILGHSHPAVSDAVTQAARTLQLVGGQHVAEIEAAELLCRHVPAFERVRFASSGSEAIQGAIRVARAATGRTRIVKFAGHYHGWLDNVLVATGQSSAAVRETAGQSANGASDLLIVDWNSSAAVADVLAEWGDEIAAVLMEPVMCNGGLFHSDPGYLEFVAASCRSAGAMLIFDEVITGIRLGLGGAQVLTGVTPDIAVIAKAVANGYPLSAFGGSRSAMEQVADGRVMHGGTYNACGVGVAAAKATLTELEQRATHIQLDARAEQLMAGLEAAASLAGTAFWVRGAGSVFFGWFADRRPSCYAEHIDADWDKYRRFAGALQSRGVRILPSGRWYLSAAHSEEDIQLTIEAAREAFNTVG